MRRETAAAATALLAEMTELADSAASELERGHPERVAPLLEAREALIARADEILPALPVAGGDEGGVLAAALRLKAADARLRLALASGLQETARELDLMEAGEAVRSAYGQRRGERGTIDIVR